MEARSTGTKLGPNFMYGDGVWLVSENNEKYFDATSGSGAISLGHQNPAIIDKCQNQLMSLTHTGCKLGSVTRHDLACKIAEITPFKNANVLFSVIGTEAVETAFKVARAYTGRKHIAGLEYAFHGKSHAALNITWREYFKKYSYISSDDSCIVPAVPLETEQQVADALSEFENILKNKEIEGKLPAALIFEPVQVTEGVKIFPVKYHDGLIKISRQFGVLTIIDEIYTGFGRCGRLFYCNYLSETPDILLLGKSLGNGMPISLVVGEKTIINSLESGVQTSTYSGSPLACAAANEVIKQVINNSHWETAEKHGKELFRHISNLMKVHKLGSGVRQIGLLVGFDLEKDNFESKKILEKFIQIALDKKILLFGGGVHGNTVKLVPPITMTGNDLVFLKDTLESVFQCLVEELNQ